LSRDLPRVRDLTPREFGVHDPVVELDYVPREREADAQRILDQGKPLLALGGSMAGKTRMAVELLRRRCPDRPVLIPDRTSVVADLDRRGGYLSGGVLWLDDLERYLREGGLTVGMLDRVLAGGNLVVATMRAAAYQDYLPTGQLRPPGSDVVEWFTRVWLDRTPTPGETAELDRIGDPGLRDRIGRYGLAEYVGGAHYAVEQLRVGAAAQSLGYALVRAAADWRRTGLTTPVPTDTLTALAAPYLPAQRQHLVVDDDDDAETETETEAAQAWAARPIADTTIALLERQDGGWTVFDYALDHLTAENDPIPDGTWQAAATADIAQRGGQVGYVAATVYDRRDIAEQIWRALAQDTAAGHAGVMHNLGVLAERRGDAAEAEQWYRTAAAAGHSGAMTNLGVLLARRGDTAEAEQWWRTAAAAGDSDAMSNLGAVLARRGDAADAERWWRRAAAAGQADAMFNLGLLLERRGDAAEAEQWYRTAAATGHIGAMTNLGLLLARRGDTADAEQWYRKAAEGDT
jgi:TPR repeat protein